MCWRHHLNHTGSMHLSVSASSTSPLFKLAFFAEWYDRGIRENGCTHLIVSDHYRNDHFVGGGRQSGVPDADNRGVVGRVLRLPWPRLLDHVGYLVVRRLVIAFQNSRREIGKTLMHSGDVD